MDMKLTSANLKALSLLESASKVMGDMKDEIANLKERNNMMVKQLGDYYNCLDKDELDGLAMLEGSPLEHSDYIRYLNDVMRNYAFMGDEAEGLVSENKKLNDENISLKQKVGEFIAISDKITNENFGLQKDYCEQNKEIAKLKEKVENNEKMKNIFRSDIEEYKEELLEKDKAHKVVVEDTKNLAIAKLVLERIGGEFEEENKKLLEDLKESDANFKEEREEKRVLQKANTKLKEEIAHKNEKFCEWIEENKELTEYNKMLREEYIELYELLNCEDHSAAKCCINELKARIVFLEEKVDNVLTNDSYLECCGLEKAKEDKLKAHIEGAKKYSYDITSLYPTGVIYANGSSSEMDNGIETLANDEDIALTAKEYK